MTVTAELRPSQGIGWRTPLVIIICGCAIALLSFGPRSSVGFFIQPMGRDLSLGRDVFGLALALQNLLWGLGQPVAGAIADRFGVMRVMCVGALLYAAGLLMMRYATTPLSLDLSAGVLIGFGLVRLFVQSRTLGIQQAAADGKTRHCARRRHRRRIVRAIPVRAVRRGADRQFRLAVGADGVCGPDAADHPAVAGAGDAARDFGQCAGCGAAVVQDGAGGSVRPSLLRAAGAGLLHLRLSARLHHRASAGVSVGSRRDGANRRLGDRRHRLVQHRRFAGCRLAAEHISQALHPFGDLFYARVVDRRLHLVSDHDLLGDRVRRRHRPDLAVDGAADFGAGRA